MPSVALVRPDFFGGSVGRAGDWAAVGAPHANLEIEENMGWAGRVFVFHRRGGTWSETAVLDPTDMLSDLPEGYGFGNSLDMSEGILAIGATGDESTDQGVDADPSDRRGYKVGVVWAYRLEGESWLLDAFIKSETALTTDTFGYRVVLDGSRLLVGAPFEDRFGSGVITEPHGVGVGNSGGAFLFVRGADGRWRQEAYFKASNPESEDYFGIQLAIHGDLIAVQALREDSGAGGLWSGDPDDNSQTNAGAVYFYREFSDGWRLTSYLKGPYPDAFDRFGRGLAIGDWGFAVGSPSEDSGLSDDPSDNSDENNGSVYVFDVSRVELAEVCDGVDNDRDGMVDETATECGGACVEGRCE